MSVPKKAAKDVALAGDPTKAIIRAIAMDIGKEVVHHISIMYPNAAAQLPGSGKLSVRNCVYNEIMAAIQVSDEGQIIARLQDRKAFRRKIAAVYSKIREPKVRTITIAKEGRKS